MKDLNIHRMSNPKAEFFDIFKGDPVPEGCDREPNGQITCFDSGLLKMLGNATATSERVQAV